MQNETQARIETKRFPILNFKIFCGQLMNRIYPLIRWEANLQGQFILFINILDRRPEHMAESMNPKTLIYAGMHQQAQFFKDDKEGLEILRTQADKLERGEIFIEESVESRGFYEQFSRGKLGLKDFTVKDLKDYFKRFKEEGKFNNELQGHEYPILRYLFNIDTDHYLSLPVIQFGDLDGVIHIIFKKKNKKTLSNKIVVANLIKQFTKVYENMLIAWDLEGDNITINSLLEEQLNYLETEKYAKAALTNPIYRELNYQQYYKDSRAYFLERVKQINSVPAYLKNEHRKRAIIAILIDSYAHNISAHSLTVLKWWFQQRAKHIKVGKMAKIIEGELPFNTWGTPIADFLMSKFPRPFSREDVEKGIQSILAWWYGKLKEREEENLDYRAVRDQLFPLAKQLAPLFKFLLEKGAFWSGITRDRQFGGEIRNLFDIIWNDFIENPLYLGTIAYSEGITKLNIHIRCYSGRPYLVTTIGESKQPFKRTYQLKEVNGIYLNGHFATIDVGGVENNSINHDYVTKGKLYKALQTELSNCEVFFPGGVVGKHAFFTLIENEIRNVKHYTEGDLSLMRKEGLNLFLAIRPSTLSKPNPDLTNKPLFKIGVWIGVPSRLYDENDHFIQKRFSRLLEDIITEGTQQAKLGGTYQDKICSAMLFNGTFNSVENHATPRDERYYPWIRAAYSTDLDSQNPTIEHDFEVQRKNYETAFINLADKSKHPNKGLFKKYFHLWQGAHIYHLTDANDLETENTNRFKLVNVILEKKNGETKEDWAKRELKLRQDVRAAGTIRVLSNLSKDATWLEAYRQWLKKWLKEKNGRIRFIRRATEVGHLVFDQSQIRYYGQDEYLELPEQELEQYAGEDYKTIDLPFAHGANANDVKEDQPLLSIRNNGVLSQKYFTGLQSIDDFDNASMTEEHVYELLEVLQTRICIFDKRVAERVTPKKRKFLSEKLNCHISDEKIHEWNKTRNKDLGQFHFIVLHLSFIEALRDKKGKRYGEDGMVKFIEEQIGDQLGDNCLFVITTGRGREQWWHSLQDSKYAINTTFKPVEMLIEAVESATLKRDDIELKHNLIKVLLGS